MIDHRNKEGRAQQIHGALFAMLVVCHLVGWFVYGGRRGALIGLASTAAYTGGRLAIMFARRRGML